ncbi:hypothetical protein AB0K04_17045 [Micromonospora coxensis]|uniref:hypothetical protein n=1 Tax=Micromonospora coxensis TaxID=356852 RepID=UPI0034170CAC
MVLTAKRPPWALSASFRRAWLLRQDLRDVAPAPNPNVIRAEPEEHEAVKRSEIVRTALGTCMSGVAHVGGGLVAAHSLWGGRDSPAEWTFYYAGAGCCLLPLTGTIAWLLTRAESTKRVGQGVIIGAVAATAVAGLALLTGYAPPWISAGWTGDGWS